MKRALIWARVSSPGQDDQSLESQVYRAKELAEQKGYAVGHQLERVWTSTDLRPCPEYQQLLRLIYNREIDSIFMLDRDRLEAQPEKRVAFLSYCQEHDVEVFVCQGPPFVEGSDGKLLEYVYAMGKEKANIRAQLGAKTGLEDRAKGRSRKSGYRQLPPTTAHVYGMTFNGEAYIPDDNYENAQLIFQL
jgi:DNA invertase Pin-like site-specific DNA recombinase